MFGYIHQASKRGIHESKVSIKDCRQITFVTLNRFCPLSKRRHPICSWRTISKWMEYLLKSNRKYIPFLHCISSFDGTSYKNLSDISHQIFYFVLFLLAFLTAGIIFHKSWELYSTISGKSIFALNFPF